MKKITLLIATVLVASTVIFFACQKEIKLGSSSSSDLSNGKAASTIDVPQISCGTSGQTYIEVQVCAPSGGTGLPAGFTVQWMSKADFVANGSKWPSSNNPTGIPSFCAGSFSGNANLSRYNLAAGQCVTIRVGDILLDEGASTGCGNPILKCNTEYVFRAFGHATSTLKQSGFGSTLTCSTSSCDNTGPCTLTQGYWKTHGPLGCQTGNNTNMWPVTSLTLGTVAYTDDQICSILNAQVAGNGLIDLAHQLIAAKLNVANGSGTVINITVGSVTYTDANDLIAAADAVIGGLVVPPVGSGSLAPSSVSAYVFALDTYNSGGPGAPGHCGDTEPQ